MTTYLQTGPCLKVNKRMTYRNIPMFNKMLLDKKTLLARILELLSKTLHYVLNISFYWRRIRDGDVKTLPTSPFHEITGVPHQSNYQMVFPGFDIGIGKLSIMGTALQWECYMNT